VSLTPPLLSGSKEEWSLLRRHPSERIFGIQVAGNRPGVLVPAAEVIAKEFGSTGLDFVDVNCGCPIDLVFKGGSGSARGFLALSLFIPQTNTCLLVLTSPPKLSKILTGMNYALGEIPLTVKLRTGVKDGKNLAERLMLGLVGGRVGVGGIAVRCSISLVNVNVKTEHTLATRKKSTTTLHTPRRLGLHQTMRRCCSCKRGGRRS